MKKFFKILGIFLLILVVGIVILSFTGEKDVSVKRTKSIEVPVELVYAKVSDFNEFNSYSPWYALDESQKTEIIGDGNQVGDKFSWTSESFEVGSGELEMVNMEENTSVDQKLTIKGMFEITHNCGYTLEKKGEMETEITWYLEGENNFIGRVFSNFMSTDDMVGGMYEDGLEKLRKELEGK